MILIFVIFTSIFNIGSPPPLWWDEGWTLSVARNWVELGHFGRLLNGELHSAGLAGHFPVVSAMALSFKLFGIGIWQGRLPGVNFTIAALGTMYFLAYCLYNRKIAIGTIAALTLMTVSMETHPIMLSSQVLGEIPAMFYLVAGYALLLCTLEKSNWIIFPVIGFWGIGIQIKAQVLPFWLISLVVPFLIATYKRYWRAALILFLCVAGSWFIAELVSKLPGWIFARKNGPREPIAGLIGVTGMVRS